MAPLLIQNLRVALAETDRIAYDNVTHDDDGNSILDQDGRPIKGKFARGGPFGAMLAITFPDGTLEQIGEARGNNVIGSGIASYHAEDQAMRPDNYQKLVERLTELKEQRIEVDVWMISSGQSCTNCHTKQEAMARDLQAKGLLPGKLKNFYGATYEDTLQIAQFYDAQYAYALAYAVQNPHSPDNLIKQSQADFETIPAEAQKILGLATSPIAIVIRNGEVYAVGKDTRGEFDLYSTAEVNAIQAACVRYGKENKFPWTVDGELLTTNSSIGPLSFAEIAWTGIRNFTHVKMTPPLSDQQFTYQEMAGLTNDDGLRIIAGGYQDPLAMVEVYHDMAFNNTAQPKWAQMLAVNNEQLYNGAAVTPEVEAFGEGVRSRFVGEDICCTPTDMLRRLNEIPLQSPLDERRLG